MARKNVAAAEVAAEEYTYGDQPEADVTPPLAVEVPLDHITLVGGQVVEFHIGNLPADMIRKLAVHGLQQKVNDRMAGAKSDAEHGMTVNGKPVKAMDGSVLRTPNTVFWDTWLMLAGGIWGKRRTSAGSVFDPIEAHITTVLTGKANALIAAGRYKPEGTPDYRRSAKNVAAVVEKLRGNESVVAQARASYQPAADDFDLESLA